MEYTKEWWRSKANAEEGCESVQAGIPEPLPMWTVTGNPSDYPGKFVARLFLIKSGDVFVTTDHIVESEIDVLRQRLIEEMGMSYPLVRN